MLVPIKQDIKKVLVIGSGPIVIGQAAEFDYSGTQACLTLKEEGCEVILINNNPATIMTDDHIADTVYFEPLTVDNIIAIIQKEKPDGILVSVSGQTGLNLAFKLHEKDIFNKYNLTVLGTSIDSIEKGEDRDKFRALMNEINEPVPESDIVDHLDQALLFSEKVGYPIIVRPAYTLGGSGGGIATDKDEFIKLVSSGLRASPIQQCLIEKSIAGWKEVELEVIRDKNDNTVIICEIENIDPVGIHTGDSIVVSPVQTLSDSDMALLRNASKKIVSELGIIGACNVQLAFSPTTDDYFIIEVNPRVSRSSALASKATGYPIAKVATKLSLGYQLDELYYSNTKNPLSEYEPKLDYTIVKFPRWPFDKFVDANRKLGTQMKATGEVMAIEKTLPAALQKAIRSLELEVDGIMLPKLKGYSDEELNDLLVHADDRRFFILLELMSRGVEIAEIHDKTKINHYFLQEIKLLIDQTKLAESKSIQTITKEELLKLKQTGFTDKWLANTWQVPVQQVSEHRKQWQITPKFGKIDACMINDNDKSAYYYTSWNLEDDRNGSTSKEKVLIVGSGPIRIGQGVEFDYCSVQGVLALQKAGFETVLINNNPATVSTDYEIADKLYFDPITVEDVLHIVEYENIDKVIIQLGGQTAINLVEGLEDAGVTLLGSSLETVDQLEDRDLFYQFMQEIDLPHIPGLTVTNEQELTKKVKEIGFPVLVRPSYVIGGKGMLVLNDEEALNHYMEDLNSTLSFPILIDAYYPGKEVEIDVVTDGKDILIPGIFEHIEKAGVHSGDSMAVMPPVSLSDEMKEQITYYAKQIALNTKFKGLFNVQFVIYQDTLYVLEVNPRASRTVPMTSKVTGINLIELAANILIGKQLKSLTNNLGLVAENPFYTVKAPVFSTMKLPGVDPKLVPEMKSTGELIALADTFNESVTKAFIWNEQLQADYIAEEKQIYVTTNDDKIKGLEKQLNKLGITLQFAEDKTIDDWLKENNAFGLYSIQNDSYERERALEYDLHVMSVFETIQAFAMMTEDNLAIKSINQWLETMKKEVILQ